MDMHMYVLCGWRCVWMFVVGEALVEGETMFIHEACVVCMNICRLLLFVVACADVVHGCLPKC